MNEITTNLPLSKNVIMWNHNQSLVTDCRREGGGGIWVNNHNQTVVYEDIEVDPIRDGGSGWVINHNQTFIKNTGADRGEVAIDNNRSSEIP